MICSDIWKFGSQELIAAISAFCTLLAVIVSLILARKGKVVKYKVVVNEKFCGLSIYNTGHAKFNITAFGVMDGKRIFYDREARYSKLLVHSIKSTYNSTTFQDVSFNAVCVEPGDLIEVGLEHFDFGLLKSDKVKLFLKINNKIKTYKVDAKNSDKSQTVRKDKYVSITAKELNEVGYFFR